MVLLKAVGYKCLDFLKALWNNFAFVMWFLFYMALFLLFTGGYAIYFYIVTVPLAFSPMAEGVWRMVSGVRPLRGKTEKQRLYPLFKEVYEGAITVNPRISKRIKLYVHEDMDINAFAFGRKTMIFTRGSIELLSDESLKGLIAHELGHFNYWHTHALLLSTVGNLPMVLILKKLFDLKNHFSGKLERDEIVQRGFRGLYNIIYYFFRGIHFIGEMILMNSSRRHEFQADEFARRSGFGYELAYVLGEINRISMSGKWSIKDRLLSTHPQINRRIEALEKNMASG